MSERTMAAICVCVWVCIGGVNVNVYLLLVMLLILQRECQVVYGELLETKM